MDDWEILHNLIGETTGEDSISSIEDVFRDMVSVTPALSGMQWERIGDLGQQLDSNASPVQSRPAGVA